MPDTPAIASMQAAGSVRAHDQLLFLADEEHAHAETAAASGSPTVTSAVCAWHEGRRSAFLEAASLIAPVTHQPSTGETPR